MLLVCVCQSAAAALSPIAAAPLPPHLPLNETVAVISVGQLKPGLLLTLFASSNFCLCICFSSHTPLSQHAADSRWFVVHSRTMRMCCSLYLL